MLAWFRDHPNITRLGAGFHLSQPTAYRYLHEGIDVLSAQAPGLREVLDQAVADGLVYLILDGKIIDTDRVHGKKTSLKGHRVDTWFAKKTRDHGGNIQALMNPDGLPLWVSDAEPGGVPDITAYRLHLTDTLPPYLPRLPILADTGYLGADPGIHVPARKLPHGQEHDINTRTRNKLIRGLRGLGERGFALLTQRWTTLHEITLTPERIGDIARAALVLTLVEHRKLT